MKVMFTINKEKVFEEAANMIYNDHYESAKEFVPETEMPRFFYLEAVEKLKDVDRPKFVRKYFDV